MNKESSAQLVCVKVAIGCHVVLNDPFGTLDPDLSPLIGSGEVRRTDSVVEAPSCTELSHLS